MQAALDKVTSAPSKGEARRSSAKPKLAPKSKSKKHEPEPEEPSEGPGVSEDEGSEVDSQDEQEISEGAKLGRLRRLCERKPSGKLRVPDAIHDMWKQGGHKRQELLRLLEEAGWQEDPPIFANIYVACNICTAIYIGSLMAVFCDVACRMPSSPR